jgi:hypothetical protein
MASEWVMSHRQIPVTEPRRDNRHPNSCRRCRRSVLRYSDRVNFGATAEGVVAWRYDRRDRRSRQIDERDRAARGWADIDAVEVLTRRARSTMNAIQATTRRPPCRLCHDHPAAVEQCLNCARVSACPNISLVNPAEQLSKRLGMV